MLYRITHNPIAAKNTSHCTLEVNMEPELFFSTLKHRIKKEWILCFCSAISFGIAAHIYKFLNHLPNWDSLLNLYSSQNKIDLGRCFLSVGCLLGSYYDLPWINGMLSLLYLALSAVCISILFDVRKTLPLILIGGMVTTFPTVTSTMSYNLSESLALDL